MTNQTDPKQTSISCMETAPMFAEVPSTHQWVRNGRWWYVARTAYSVYII